MQECQGSAEGPQISVPHQICVKSHLKGTIAEAERGLGKVLSSHQSVCATSQSSISEGLKEARGAITISHNEYFRAPSPQKNLSGIKIIIS